MDLPAAIADLLASPARADEFARELVEFAHWRDNGFSRREARAWLLQPSSAFGQMMGSTHDPEIKRQLARQLGQRLGDLEAATATVDERALLAVRYHVEDERPLSPAMLAALACIMGLVIWRDGKPLPAESLRPWLGLPKAHYPLFPDVFFRAANVLADATAKGETLTDSEFARRVGQGSRNALKKWRADYDLARFAHVEPDPWFPFGLSGVPDDLIMTLPGVDAECENVADHFAAYWRKLEGKWKAYPPAKLDVEPRVRLFRIALARAKQGLPPPPSFVRALAAVLRLDSPATGQPIIREFRSRLTGCPKGIADPAGWAKATEAEAVAIRKGLGNLTADALEEYLRWRATGRADDEVFRRLARRTALKAKSTEGVLLRWWPADLDTVSTASGIMVPTLAQWRDRDDFRAAVMETVFADEVAERDRIAGLVAVEDARATRAGQKVADAEALAGRIEASAHRVELARRAGDYVANVEYCMSRKLRA